MEPRRWAAASDWLIEIADDDPETLQAAFAAQGWGDGLPVVAPTPDAGRRDARRATGDPDEALATLLPRAGDRHPPRRRDQRGARRLHRRRRSPSCSRAVRALCRPEVNLRGVNATTHPVAPLVIVHGEIADRAGFNAGARRVRARATAPTRPSAARCGWCCCTSPARGPGSGDAATQGQPAKYTYCVAENLGRVTVGGVRGQPRRRRAERGHRALRRGSAQRARQESRRRPGARSSTRSRRRWRRSA